MAGAMVGAEAVLARLWRDAAGDPAALERVSLTGADPVLPTRFCIATAAMATIGATALAAAELWRIRTGREQRVAVDARAAVTAFRSERYLRVNGDRPGDPWGPLSGFHRTGDGRFVQLHCNFPHHEAGVVRLLGCEATRPAVAASLLAWKAAALEEALAAAGMCAAMVRTQAEWREEGQARALEALPLFEIARIGDAPPEPLPPAGRPLHGVRALDLTRVIAGPVCGRSLAGHGADVLLITAPHLPSIDVLAIDTGRGKRAAHLDLRRAEDHARLRDLARGADVFVQAYRPGALAARGFAPEDLAALRPGIVYVTLSAYGHAGPWRDRRGFDSLVQSATGIADEEGRASGRSGPRHLPAQVLDHATGYLAAFGAMVALCRRAREGGSYLVRVSLAQTGRWVDGLGRAEAPAPADLGLEDVADLLEESASDWGLLRAAAPAARLSETPARLVRPAVRLGTHAAAWEPA